MKKNDITHAVLWPSKAKAAVHLMFDGEEVGSFGLSQPMLGIDLSKMMPDGATLEFTNVFIGSLLSPLVIGQKLPFDTDVKTERRSVSLEERLMRLEQKERRNAASLKATQQREEQLLARLRERDDTEVLEPVTDAETVTQVDEVTNED